MKYLIFLLFASSLVGNYSLHGMEPDRKKTYCDTCDKFINSRGFTNHCTSKFHKILINPLDSQFFQRKGHQAECLLCTKAMLVNNWHDHVHSLGHQNKSKNLTGKKTSKKRLRDSYVKLPARKRSPTPYNSHIKSQSSSEYNLIKSEPKEDKTPSLDEVAPFLEDPLVRILVRNYENARPEIKNALLAISLLRSE